MLKKNTTPYKVSEIRLVYSKKFKPEERPTITNASDCHEVFMSVWDRQLLGFLEEFKILLLNRSHKVLALYNVSCGGMAGTVVDPKIVFAAALKCASSSIILAHNHPSGNLKPSQSDIELTRKLQAAGRLLEIEVLDHLIISEEGYYSLAEAHII